MKYNTRTVSQRNNTPAITRTTSANATAVPMEQNAFTKSNIKNSYPVHVYCRVRPLPTDLPYACSSVSVENSNTVILLAPDSAEPYTQRTGIQRETQYIFEHIFEKQHSQADVFNTVALPLVENLLRGCNGLLFSYGVTGSGKTYTMTGDAHNCGIMPRCLDVLFHNILHRQTEKFVFKPDKFNSFEILSEAEAAQRRKMDSRQFQMNANNGATAAFHAKDLQSAHVTDKEQHKFMHLNGNSVCAVFITYIEVYNNCVYDLLEEGAIQKNLQSKLLRADVKQNMFVHGATELEVKSVEEALNVFYMGQQRKRMGHTILNSESSRSHSVFNIRLVQAPTDGQHNKPIQNKHMITVSQLSLVDLAGSERLSRTKNTGMRMRETCNINNSLMTLRICLEYLRENQMMTGKATATAKKIPYRDAKITHLFKNYFDGDGQVAMIVCINPRAEDYDENAQVLKFAEMTQEVQIICSTPSLPAEIKCNANALYSKALINLDCLDFSLQHVDYIEMEKASTELKFVLQQRIEKRQELRADLNSKCNSFRQQLHELEQQRLTLRTENAALQTINAKQQQQSLMLCNQLKVQQGNIDALKQSLSNRDTQIHNLKQKLVAQQKSLNQQTHDHGIQTRKLNSKMTIEKNKIDRDYKVKLREMREKFQDDLRLKDEKLRLVSDILQAHDASRLKRARSSLSFTSNKTVTAFIGTREPKQQSRRSRSMSNCELGENQSASLTEMAPIQIKRYNFKLQTMNVSMDTSIDKDAQNNENMPLDDSITLEPLAIASYQSNCLQKVEQKTISHLRIG